MNCRGALSSDGFALSHFCLANSRLKVTSSVKIILNYEDAALLAALAPPLIVALGADR